MHPDQGPGADCEHSPSQSRGASACNGHVPRRAPPSLPLRHNTAEAGERVEGKGEKDVEVLFNSSWMGWEEYGGVRGS